MGTTTTSRIEKLSNGIIVNKYFTKSCVKEPYLIEQSIELEPLLNANSIGLLLDCRRVQLSIEEVHRIATSPYFSDAKPVAVLTSSRIQKYALRWWTTFKNKTDQISFFVDKGNAFSWLHSHNTNRP